MKQRLLLVLCSVVFFSGLAAAQAKTVTNADLEKFKQKRLQSEQELQAYYAKIGLTKADIERRDAEDTRAREELSARLRSIRLERERAEDEARYRESLRPQVNVIYPQAETGFPGYFLYGNRWYPSGQFGDRRVHSAIRWRATPGGIIYEPGSRSSFIWSAPVNQRPTGPMWRNPRSH